MPTTPTFPPPTLSNSGQGGKIYFWNRFVPKKTRTVLINDDPKQHLKVQAGGACRCFFSG